MTTQPFIPNHHEMLLLDAQEISSKLGGRWPQKNVAFLITHGIGNQNPLEALDMFARGIVGALEKFGSGKDQIHLTHLLAKKPNSDGTGFWYDNFIRISKHGSPFYIDIFEYYWANQTENRTSFKAVLKWLKDVTDGARKFYKSNVVLCTSSRDESIFINKKKGFNSFAYFFFLRVLGAFMFAAGVIIKGIISLIRLLPPVGNALADWLSKKLENTAMDLTNILGDITIYNVRNVRNEHYEIRKKILNGAVGAVRYLLEARKDNKEYIPYDKVIVAGHSLGSQITFDALNRITHHINLGELKGYDQNGNAVIPSPNGSLRPVNKVLDTILTFGSPLDKIAFFLREQCEENMYIRKQVLENFHCFKQRSWLELGKNDIKIDTPITRIFDDIAWRNYYDSHDYVSGSLDYYHKLTNVNCSFKGSAFSFTHSNYWNSTEFFADIASVAMN